MTEAGAALRPRLLLVVSVGLVLAATLTPSGVASPVRAEPWCLACGGYWLADAISNVLLFAPFGLALRLWRPSLPWRVLLLSAATFSLGVESLQALGIPHGRSAALADVLANTAGAALGFFVGGWRHLLRPQSPRIATLSALVWSGLVVAVLVGTSAALESVESIKSVRHTDGKASPILRQSALPFTPNYGWFAGHVDSATINDFSVVRRETGPVIVESSAALSAADLRVTARGSDLRNALVPLVYVHLAGRQEPMLMLGVHEEDVTLAVARRGSRWGLVMPTLTVRGAFRGRTHGDSTVTQVRAQARADRLELEIASGSTTASASMAFTPTLGWATFQTVVESDALLAPVVQALWIAVLVVPIGWWSARAGPWWIASAISAALVVVTGAIGSVLFFRVAAVPPVELVEVVAALALGFSVSRVRGVPLGRSSFGVPISAEARDRVSMSHADSRTDVAPTAASFHARLHHAPDGMTS